MAEVPVTVAVRVRPLLEGERLLAEQSCVRVVSSNQVVIGKDKAFTFDHVFGANFCQSDLYETVITNLVEGVAEGYNATVFAYGQTGSGKTHTMGGLNLPPDREAESGVTPRALRHLFQLSAAAVQQGVQCSLKVSYIEIYKEELRDLLNPEASSRDLQLREDEAGTTILSGVREQHCTSLEEALSLLRRGSALRQTGMTGMNEHSSRSHAVFTITMTQRWHSDPSNISADTFLTQHMSAKLHLVDLAGSERAHRTKNVGARFKESVHINSGLLALGNVISALADVKRRIAHVPYRDSKITRLLKDSLGGNSRTIMVCCVSPALTSFDETINSLNYANRAKNIRNKPVINRDPEALRLEEMKSEMAELREQLERQRTQAPPAEELISLRDRLAHYETLIARIHERMGGPRDSIALLDGLTPADEVQHLQQQLELARQELATDEEVFARRGEELASLQRELNSTAKERAELAAALAERDAALVSAQAQLVQKQCELEQSRGVTRSVSVACSLDVSGGGAISLPTTTRRARSVPVGSRQAQLSARPISRHIHTSPALFSAERVMQHFRARSALIVSALEEEDEVEIENVAPEKLLSGVRRRGTFKDDNEITDPTPLQERLAAVSAMSPGSAGSGDADRLAELSLQIKLKEELLRDLVRQKRDASAARLESEERAVTLTKEKAAAEAELAAVRPGPALQSAKQRIVVLEKREKELESKVAKSSQQAAQVAEMKTALASLKTERDNEARRLGRSEAERTRLERDLAADRAKLKQLSSAPVQDWEAEVAKVVAEQERLTQFEEELGQREALLEKREALCHQRQHATGEEATELDEGMAAVDLALEYRASLANLAPDPRASLELLQHKAGELPPEDLKVLTRRLFAELVAARGVASSARRAVEKIKLELLQQVAVSTDQQNVIEQLSTSSRLQDVEKELYYYKKTSRSLRRRLNESGGTLISATTTPVKMSRSQLRELSQQELSQRLHDSLDASG